MTATPSDPLASALLTMAYECPARCGSCPTAAYCQPLICRARLLEIERRDEEGESAP